MTGKANCTSTIIEAVQTVTLRARPSCRRGLSTSVTNSRTGAGRTFIWAIRAECHSSIIISNSTVAFRHYSPCRNATFAVCSRILTLITFVATCTTRKGASAIVSSSARNTNTQKTAATSCTCIGGSNNY